MPVDVRMVVTSVGENSRFDDALADLNLASTRLGRASDRPRSILMDGGWAMTQMGYAQASRPVSR